MIRALVSPVPLATPIPLILSPILTLPKKKFSSLSESSPFLSVSACPAGAYSLNLNQIWSVCPAGLHSPESLPQLLRWRTVTGGWARRPHAVRLGGAGGLAFCL